MSTEQYKELMNKALDNELDVHEKQELDSYLDQHPEAKSEFQGLKDLKGFLSKYQEIEPPENLKSDIMNNIDPGKYANNKIGFFEGLNQFFRQKMKFRYSFGFASGVVACILVFAFVFNYNTIDKNNLVGTMLMDGSFSDLDDSQKFEISSEGVSGNIAVLEESDYAVVYVTLYTSHSVDLSLLYDHNYLSFNGFRQDKSNTVKFAQQVDNLQLTHRGNNSYNFIFRKMTTSQSSIDLEIIAERLLFNQNLQIKGGDK